MSMEIDDYSVRAFEPKRDAFLVGAWARAHGRDGLPLEMLPPDGIVVLDSKKRPVAAAWLYKALGVGVSFLEHVHTAPGLSLAASRVAVNTAIEYLKLSARDDGYGIIIAHTTPALAREAVRVMGWQELGRDRVEIAVSSGLGEQKGGQAA